MIKIYACDLDGTLLPRGRDRLSAEIENKIKAVIADGAVFAAVSGRDYCSLRSVLDFCADDVYYFCCGGSVCLKGGRVIYSKPVSSDAVISAIKAAKSKGIGLVLSGADREYVYGDDDFCARIGRIYGDSAVRIFCNRGVDASVYKISFYCGDGKSIDPSAVGLRQFYNRNGWEEYISRIADKGDALSSLMMRLGVFKTDVISAGDDLSDAPMLKKAGRAYAFGRELALALGLALSEDPREIFDR